MRQFPFIDINIFPFLRSDDILNRRLIIFCLLQPYIPGDCLRIGDVVHDADVIVVGEPSIYAKGQRSQQDQDAKGNQDDHEYLIDVVTAWIVLGDNSGTL